MTTTAGPPIRSLAELAQLVSGSLLPARTKAENAGPQSWPGEERELQGKLSLRHGQFRSRR
jgi:hypothetical protein